MANHRPSRRGVSITEMLVVVGIIIVLLGLLFPALAGVRRSGQMTESMSRLRQIATWMNMYSGEFRDYVLPSHFKYAGNSYPGEVRSNPDPPTGSGSPFDPSGAGCLQYCGTWTDILWTLYVGVPINEGQREFGNDYRYDSPDVVLHRLMGDTLVDPFRSAAPNSKNAPTKFGGGPSISPSQGPTPFAGGAQEIGLPGYFAANNFFNANAGSPSYTGFHTNGQIKIPDRSMYLVDSFAGETIEAEEDQYLVQDTTVDPPEPGPAEVDFRYSGTCLMLFLDGHMESVGKWDDICDLEGPEGRNIRIRDLEARKSPCPP